MKNTIFIEYPDVITINDLMHMLNIGRNTAYKLLKEDKIKSVQIGKQYRILKNSIIDFIQTGK